MTGVIPIGHSTPRRGSEAEAPIAIADMVIDRIRQAGGDIRLRNGNVELCQGSLWRIANRGDVQQLRCWVQQACEDINQAPTSRVIRAAWMRLVSHPALFVPVDQAELPPPPPPDLFRTCRVGEWSKLVTPVELGRVARIDAHLAFQGWWRAQINDTIPPLSSSWFLTRLRVALPYVCDCRIRGVTFLAGIVLSDEALRFWQLERARRNMPTCALAVNRMVSVAKNRTPPGATGAEGSRHPKLDVYVQKWPAE
jgi:hypothetical protein